MTVLRHGHWQVYVKMILGREYGPFQPPSPMPMRLARIGELPCRDEQPSRLPRCRLCLDVPPPPYSLPSRHCLRARRMARCPHAQRTCRTAACARDVPYRAPRTPQAVSKKAGAGGGRGAKKRAESVIVVNCHMTRSHAPGGFRTQQTFHETWVPLLLNFVKHIFLLHTLL